MISLNNLNISFGDRIIFANASITAYRGGLTVIAGKSGSGKSTLIKALLFRFPAEYVYQDRNLSGLNDDEQAVFIFDHVSAVDQNPLFDENLTIEQNREFLKKLHHVQDGHSALAEKIGIQSVMKKYPHQLSGGERMRAALYLALLKNPEILILDEPTAALDVENKEILISVLKEYSKQHIVIVTSHDRKLIEAGDTVYTIKDHGLLCRCSASGQEPELMRTEKAKFDYADHGTVILQEFRHHIVLNLLKVLVLSVCIVFLFLSFSLNNRAIEKTSEALNRMSSTELLVYLHQAGNDGGFSYSGKEWPLPDEYAERIKQLDNIGDLNPFINATGYFYREKPDEPLADEINFISYPLSLDQDQVQVGILEDTLSIAYRSFTEEDLKQNGEVIIKEFSAQDEGVYISSALFAMLGGKTDHDDYFLNIPLPIPVYDANGLTFNEVQSDNEDDNGSKNIYYNTNTICCVKEDIRLPVKGVLDGRSLGLGDDRESIYIPYDYWQGMIDACMETYEIKDSFVYFQTVGDFNDQSEPVFYEEDDLPEQYKTPGYIENGLLFDAEVLRAVLKTRWKPNALVMYVKDLAKIDDTVDKIKKIGLAVENAYVNTSHILKVQEDTRKLLMVISSILFVIVIFGYFVIQYIEKERTEGFVSFLTHIGFTKRADTAFCRKKWTFQTIVLALVSLVLYFAIPYILAMLHITFIGLDLRMILGIIAVCVISEYLYPRLLHRRNQI